MGGVDAGLADKPRARVRRAVCVCKVCKGRGCKGCVRVSTLWIRLAVMEGCRNQNLCLTHCLSHCLLHHHRHCQPRALSRRRLAATNGLRAHKFPPQHSRPAVVVVVEPCAQQRAHAQAHMRARSPTTHHHLLAAGEAGFTWGQPLVKCPNPHARVATVARAS